MTVPVILSAIVRRGKVSLLERSPFDRIRRLRRSFALLGSLLAPFVLAVALAASAESTGARAAPQDGPRNADDSGAKVTTSVMDDPGLRAGFQLLYQLKFDQARERFAHWQQERPAEPLGPALEAASDLFEEFY